MPVDSCPCCTGMPTEFHESLAEIAFKASICGLASRGCLEEELEEALVHRLQRLYTDIRSVVRQPSTTEFKTEEDGVPKLRWRDLADAHALVLQREVQGAKTTLADGYSSNSNRQTVADAFFVLYAAIAVAGKVKGAAEIPSLFGDLELIDPSSGRDRAALFFLFCAVEFMGCVTIRSPDECLQWLVTYVSINQYSPTGTPPILYAVRLARPTTLRLLLARSGNPFLQSAGPNDTALHRAATEGCDAAVESLLQAVIACGRWWNGLVLPSGISSVGSRLVEGFVAAENGLGRTAVMHLRATMQSKGITPDISRYEGYMRVESLVSGAIAAVTSSDKLNIR